MSHLHTVPTPGRDAEASDVEDALVEVVTALQSSVAEPTALPVGIGAAGFLDPTGRVVRFSPHVPWREEPVAERLSRRLGVPVTVENDANAAAWAEYRFGAAREEARVVLVAVGTGIGGGLLFDGAIERGAHGMAGEFGHMNVVRGGRPCPCGLVGCWERYCSGTALVTHAAEMISGSQEQEAARGMRKACGGDPTRLSGRLVAQLALDGDPGARHVIDTAGKWLGRGLSTLVATLDPGVLVVGGGLGELGEALLSPARTELRSGLAAGGHRPEPRMVPSVLGSSAGLIGAADLARCAALGPAASEHVV